MLAKFTTDELVLIPGWGPRVIVIGPLILSYGSPWALILPIISGFLAGVNPEGVDFTRFEAETDGRTDTDVHRRSGFGNLDAEQESCLVPRAIR